MAYRLSKAFDTTVESWILQQAQHDQWIHRKDWGQLKVMRIEAPEPVKALKRDALK